VRRGERADFSADTRQSGIVRESDIRGLDGEFKERFDLRETGRRVQHEISEPKFVQFETSSGGNGR
jgi:hypothetical protein